MRANVIIGLLSLLFAAVLYSIGTWTAFKRKKFGGLELGTLWAGVAFDIAATVSMGAAIGGLDLSPTGLPHTVLALLVMAGMATGAAFATYAASAGNVELQAKVARVLPIPWLAWIAVLVWGMLTKMPG